MPLADVKSVLATEDPQRRADLIAGHLQRLEDELDRTRAAVRSLRQLLRPDVRDLRVELRSVPARTIAGIRLATVGRAEVVPWYEGAIAELAAAFPAAERTGAPAGRYENELFTHDAGAATVFWPVRIPRPSGRIEVIELPAVELAVTEHAGCTTTSASPTAASVPGWSTRRSP